MAYKPYDEINRFLPKSLWVLVFIATIDSKLGRARSLTACLQVLKPVHGEKSKPSLIDSKIE